MEKSSLHYPDIEKTSLKRTAAEQICHAKAACLKVDEQSMKFIKRGSKSGKDTLWPEESYEGVM